jgi:hypothetical protein
MFQLHIDYLPSVLARNARNFPCLQGEDRVEFESRGLTTKVMSDPSPGAGVALTVKGSRKKIKSWIVESYAKDDPEGVLFLVKEIKAVPHADSVAEIH